MRTKISFIFFFFFVAKFGIAQQVEFTPFVRVAPFTFWQQADDVQHIENSNLRTSFGLQWKKQKSAVYGEFALTSVDLITDYNQEKNVFAISGVLGYKYFLIEQEYWRLNAFAGAEFWSGKVANMEAGNVSQDYYKFNAISPVLGAEILFTYTIFGAGLGVDCHYPIEFGQHNSYLQFMAAPYICLQMQFE